MLTTVLWMREDPVVGGKQLEEALQKFRIIPARPSAVSLDSCDLQDVDCVLITGNLPGLDAVRMLEELHTYDRFLPVIFWDPEMSAAEAVQLIRAGADHCLGYKDSVEALPQCIQNAIEHYRRRKTNGPGRNAREPWLDLLIGDTHPMQTVIETIRMIGPRRCTVLITGETGTGKDVAARAIHAASPRASQSLVSVNCSALPEHLLEAELFGHVKGAFTGAMNSRVGRFEMANRGTLFLDEIGDMPMELQAKLLRVLQDREIQRLGSSESIRIDIRLIAATNQNLVERIRQGKFREDLYYRLNVVPLEMPPLDKRRGDIPLLVAHFVDKICRLEGIAVKRVTPEALDHLRTSPWPGNIRQLENAVEKALAMSDDRETLFASDFSASYPIHRQVIRPALPAAGEPGEPVHFATAVREFEYSILQRALSKTSGNRTAAAELLGMKRTTLIMKLRNFQNCAALQPG